MANDEASRHHAFRIKLSGALLAEHIEHSLRSLLEIVRRAAVFLADVRAEVFEVRQINVHIRVYQRQGFQPLIAAGIVDHRQAGAV